MEQEKPKTKNKNFWSWNITEDELRRQVENYDTLKITQSYKGISVLIILVFLGLSMALAFFDIFVTLEEMIYSLAIYIPVLIFVYRGNRLAIIVLMALWTVEKGYQLYLSPGIMPIVWWIIIMPYFWKAFKVENERKKIPPNPIAPTI